MNLPKADSLSKSIQCGPNCLYRSRRYHIGKNYSSVSLKLFPKNTYGDVWTCLVKGVSTMLPEWIWGTLTGYCIFWVYGRSSTLINHQAQAKTKDKVVLDTPLKRLTPHCSSYFKLSGNYKATFTSQSRVWRQPSIWILVFSNLSGPALPHLYHSEVCTAYLPTAGEYNSFTFKKRVKD